MADRIKGITIEVGGDTTGLSKALSGVNKNIRDTQGQLKDVERLLKLDPSNTELLSQKQKLLGQAVGDTKGKLDALKKANEGVTANNAKYEQWRSAFAPIQSQITKTTDKLEALKKQQKEMEKAGNINTDAYHKLQGEVENTEGKLGQLKQKATDTYNELGRPMSTEQYDSLQREIVDTEQQLKKLEDQAGKSNVALQKISQAGEKVQEFGGKVSSSGRELSKVSAGLAAVGGASVAAWKTVDEAYDNIAKGTGATGEALEGLQKNFDNVYASIPAEAATAGSAIADVNTRFGFTGDALEDCTKHFLQFAEVNNTDVSTAIANVSRYMGDAGIDSSEYGKVLDQLTAASQASGLGVDKLSESLTKYGAPMRALGFDTKESIAIFAGWEKAGVNTETAFSGMKTAIGKWSKEGKDAKQEFKKTLDEIKACPDIASATGKAIEAFGQKAGPDLADAIQGGRFEYEDFLKVIDGSQGQLERTFNDIGDPIDDVKVAMQDLTLQGSKLGGSLLKTLSPMITKLVSKIKELTAWFDGLSKNQKEMVVKTGLLVAALGPLLIVLGQIITGIGGVMTMVTTIGPAISALAATGGPVLLAVAAVGLLAAAFLQAREAAKQYHDKAAELTGQETENKKAVDELHESYEQMNQRRSAASDSAEAEARKEQDLFTSLQDITDENGNVKAGYEERAKYIKGELSEALGIEIGQIDDLLKKYKEEGEGIDDLILKKQASALMDANKDNYAEAIMNRSKAYMEYNDAQKNVAETEKSLEDAEKRKALLQEDLNALQEKSITAKLGLSNESAFLKAHIDAESETISGYKDKLGGLNQTLTDAEETYVNYGAVISDQEMLMEAKDNQDLLSDAVLKAGHSFQAAEYSTKDSLERQVQTLTNEYNAMQEAVKAGAPGVTQTQVDEMARLVELSKQELNKMPTAAEQAARNTTQAIIDGNDGCRFAGSESMKAYTGGISEKIPEVAAAADQVAETAANNVKANIPLADAWGSDMMVGYIKGIRGKIGELESACRSVAGTVSDYLHFTRPEKGPLRDYEEWMPHMVSGLAGGIKENEDIVGAAAGDAASKIGEELAAGIADGVRQNKKNAQKSAEELAKAVLDAAQKKLKNEEVYRKLSLSEEVDYWNSVRKQVAEGTEARIGADEKYFKSKQDLNKKMQSAEEKYTNSVAKAYEDLNKEVKKLNQEYRDAVDSRTSEIRNAFGLFDEFTADTDQTSDKLLSNLQSQVDGLKDWRDNLNTLERRGIGDGLLTELQKLGPQSAAQIKLLTQMTDDQLNQYVNLFQQKNRIARKQAVDELAPMRNDITNQITELKRQTSKDLADYQEQYMASMSELGVALSQPAENMKLMMAQNAVEMVSGLASSIQKESGSAENTEKFKAIAENILNATGTLQADMQSVGQNAIAGIIAGLQSKEAELYAAAEGIAQRVTQAMQDTFQIHSPSVVMREKIGKNLMLGLRDGMEKYKSLAAAAVTVGMNFTGMPEGNRNNWTGIEMAELMGLLTKYLPEIAQQKCIALDGKTLVGQTVGAMDRQLANTQHLKGRIG